MMVKEFTDLGGGIIVWKPCGCMVLVARNIFLENYGEVRRLLKRPGYKAEYFKTNSGFARKLGDKFKKCAKHEA